KMSGIDDQQGLVDDLAIGRHLSRQALQGVGFGLDFHAPDVPVDHGNIDPATAMIEAKLVYDERIGTRLRVCQQPPVGGLPYITVPKRSRSHAGSIASVMAYWQRPMLKCPCGPSAPF